MCAECLCFRSFEYTINFMFIYYISLHISDEGKLWVFYSPGVRGGRDQIVCPYSPFQEFFFWYGGIGRDWVVSISQVVQFSEVSNSCVIIHFGKTLFFFSGFCGIVNSNIFSKCDNNNLLIITLPSADISIICLVHLTFHPGWFREENHRTLPLCLGLQFNQSTLEQLLTKTLQS